MQIRVEFSPEGSGWNIRCWLWLKLLVENFVWNIRKPTFNKIETTLAGAGGGAGAGYRKKHLLLKQYFINWIFSFTWMLGLSSGSYSFYQSYKYTNTKILKYKSANTALCSSCIVLVDLSLSSVCFYSV